MPEMKPPNPRKSDAIKFRVGEVSCFLHVGLYNDGKPCEVFLRVTKSGSTLHGFADAWAITFSHALQWGVPLYELCKAMLHLRFEPNGPTDDQEIREASSIMDYVARRMAKDYLSEEEQDRLSLRYEELVESDRVFQ